MMRLSGMVQKGSREQGKEMRAFMRLGHEPGVRVSPQGLELAPFKPPTMSKEGTPGRPTSLPGCGQKAKGDRWPW